MAIRLLNNMAHAEIILTENIPNLGAEADVVKVRPGYARNFLLPTGKAIEATSASVRQINHLKAKRAEREARELTESEELARKITKIELSFDLETGQSGKAFGSVSHKDITDRLLAELKGVTLPKHAIVLDRTIKESGSHEIEVKLPHQVTAVLKIVVNIPVKAAPAQAEESSYRRRRASQDSNGSED